MKDQIDDPEREGVGWEPLKTLLRQKRTRLMSQITPQRSSSDLSRSRSSGGPTDLRNKARNPQNKTDTMKQANWRACNIHPTTKTGATRFGRPVSPDFS
jgi:hypothetical protein